MPESDQDQEPQDQEPDFPTKIADSLESVADKARSLTVGKAEAAAKWTAVGTVLVIIALVAVVFLFIGVFRILGEAIGSNAAYGAIGGLFLVAALLIWRKRDPKETEDA